MYCIGHMMPRSPSQTWQISDIKVLLRIDGYNSRLCASSPSVVTHTPGLTGSWAPPCSMHLACKQFVAPNPLPKYVCVCVAWPYTIILGHTPPMITPPPSWTARPSSRLRQRTFFFSPGLVTTWLFPQLPTPICDYSLAWYAILLAAQPLGLEYLLY